MAWEGSNRKARLPSDWTSIRRRILRRDKRQCQARLPFSRELCLAVATEVDHIQAGDDHRDDNLRAICSECHARKSSNEGVQARTRRRGEIHARFRRPAEQHPGALH